MARFGFARLVRPVPHKVNICPSVPLPYNVNAGPICPSAIPLTAYGPMAAAAAAVVRGM